MKRTVRRFIDSLRHPLVTISERPLSEEEREMIVRVAIVLAVPLALFAVFVALVPAVIGLVLVDREAAHRSSNDHALAAKADSLANQNARLIAANQRILRQQALARAANREKFRATDRANCEAIENVKRSLRQLVAFNPSSTRFTLRQLGIDPNSEKGKVLFARSKAVAERAQKKLAARKGGCASLPSARATEPSAKATEPKP